MSYVIEDFDIEGQVRDLNFTFEDSYQSVINGSFKANNLGGNETDLYLDANLNSLNADIIPQDIIPKEYKLELSQGVFNDINFKGNILINNDNLSYLLKILISRDCLKN